MKVNKGYIVVKPVKEADETKTAGGIIMQTTYSDENPCIGEVVAEGEEAASIFCGGEYVPNLPPYFVGKKVLYPRGISTAYYPDGLKKDSKLCFLEARYVYAVLGDE